ncbi:hypothetical protein BDZ45DRAFT_338665 [Acephala macrosclerotiorum]|nr:hypothetical protein BDZ45DRAFT_338665 [Acephala macrosclerotiorum]
MEYHPLNITANEIRSSLFSLRVRLVVWKWLAASSNTSPLISTHMSMKSFFKDEGRAISTPELRSKWMKLRPLAWERSKNESKQLCSNILTSGETMACLHMSGAIRRLPGGKSFSAGRRFKLHQTCLVRTINCGNSRHIRAISSCGWMHCAYILIDLERNTAKNWGVDLYFARAFVPQLVGPGNP